MALDNMELDLQIEGLSLDDMLLISGPSMSGKYDLFRKILAQSADGLIVISTKNDAQRIESDLLDTPQPDRITRLGIIECSPASPSDQTGLSEGTTVKQVSSPQNMTNIGVKFTELFDELYSDPDITHVGVGIHSITSLVMHSDIRPVYQFLQVLTGQIRSAGWLGVAVVDTGVNQDDRLRMLRHHFDGVIETREGSNGSREFRIRGLAPKTSDWQVF